MDESVIGLIAVVLIVGGLIFYRQSQIEDGLVKQQQVLQQQQPPATSPAEDKDLEHSTQPEASLQPNCYGSKQRYSGTLSGRESEKKPQVHQPVCE